MSWEGILSQPNPQDLAGAGSKDPQQIIIELEFANGQISTLEHKLKTTMLSNLNLRQDIERLEMINC